MLLLFCFLHSVRLAPELIVGCSRWNVTRTIRLVRSELRTSNVPGSCVKLMRHPLCGGHTGGVALSCRFVDLKSEAHESILENILEKVDCGLQGLDVRPGGEGGVRGAATLNEHERQSASPGLDEARSASAGDDAANRVSRRSCDRSDRGLQDRGAPEQQEADLGGECGRCESATGLGSGQAAPLSTSAPPGGSTDDQARHRGDARKEVGDAESSDDATPANGRPWSPPLSEGAEVAPQELSEQARPRGAPPTLARDHAEPPDWQLGDGSRIRPITMRDQDLVALADPLATRASSGASSDGSVSDADGEMEGEREAEAEDLDSCLEVGVARWKEEEGGGVSAATQRERPEGSEVGAGGAGRGWEYTPGRRLCFVGRIVVHCVLDLGLVRYCDSCAQSRLRLGFLLFVNIR